MLLHPIRWALHEIWMAANRPDAKKAFDHLLTMYRTKYPEAAVWLEKDREELLAVYDFPAEHWLYFRELSGRARKAGHSTPLRSTAADAVAAVGNLTSALRLGH